MEQYQNGLAPEDMVRAYDALELADVHAVIAYYLRHRSQVEEYLARRSMEATSLRAMVESRLTRISREELASRR